MQNNLGQIPVLWKPTHMCELNEYIQLKLIIHVGHPFAPINSYKYVIIFYSIKSTYPKHNKTTILWSESLILN